ncbi:Multicopper oxidase family protein [Metarhizium guizhouense ARSEF 977]|uniref:Multicopper oxidase family protein n=1 Tax=Metarhizium guizhouense (strain ARSEF 977) TaxID=1276136 RepID=A0A0B4GXU0_METGA|nr:Multicopper oxidase family protein [Metarhizium guizhouense ARSEF 977]
MVNIAPRSPSIPQRPWRVLTGVSLTVFTFTGLTLFFVIVFKHLDVGFLTNARRLAATSHGTDGNLSHYGELEDDSFALHPEQHVFRAPHTIRLGWNITREARRPDGVLKDVYLINGQFPGPTIEARSGDTIEVTVTNSIAHDTHDGIAVHWHGLLMKGFNDMDGVVGVTQCSISSGQSYTYKFDIHKEQHGTFWYHAHSAVKRADGLYGGLVVHKPADSRAVQSDASLYGYESEKMLLIGDWYHLPADRVLAEYKDFRNFAYEPVPDSLLINGAGSYNCSNARPGKPVDCVETDAPEVKVPGNKAVRLRIVNTGASAGYSLQLEGANFQLITVDGGTAVSRSTPQSSTLGVLYPGERMDVLLLSDEASLNRNKPHNSSIKIILDLELMQLMNPALTRMQSFSLSWIPSAKTEHEREDRPSKVDIYNVQNAEGLLIPEDAPLRKNPVEVALLYTSLSINSFKNDEPWGELNHTSWTWKDPQARPLLAIDRNEWQNGTEQANPLRTFHVPRYEAGEDRWLDLVVNNVDDKGHPFHLVNIPPGIYDDTSSTNSS